MTRPAAITATPAMSSTVPMSSMTSFTCTLPPPRPADTSGSWSHTPLGRARVIRGVPAGAHDCHVLLRVGGQQAGAAVAQVDTGRGARAVAVLAFDGRVDVLVLDHDLLEVPLPGGRQPVARHD